MLVNGYQNHSSLLAKWCINTNINPTTIISSTRSSYTKKKNKNATTSLSPKSILQLLHTSLGSTLFKLYTKQLSLYLKSKLSLTEFEQFTNQHFLSHQVQLHNKLILSTVRSATQYDSLTSSSSSLDSSDYLPPYTRKRKNLEPHDIRRARLRKEAFALPKQDRDRIRLEIKKQEESQRNNDLFEWPKVFKKEDLSPELQQEYDRLLDVPTCQQEQELPHRHTMRDRMTCIAYENHLKSVSDDAVDLMMLGLHSYLKNLLSTILHLKRDRPLCPSSTSSLTPFPLKPQTSLSSKSTHLSTSPSSRRSTSPQLTKASPTDVLTSSVPPDPTPMTTATSSSPPKKKNPAHPSPTSPTSNSHSASSPNVATFIHTSTTSVVDSPSFSSITSSPNDLSSSTSFLPFPPSSSPSPSFLPSSNPPSSSSSSSSSFNSSSTTTTTSLSDVSVILWIQPNLTFNGFPQIQEKLMIKLWHPPTSTFSTPFSNVPTLTPTSTSHTNPSSTLTTTSTSSSSSSSSTVSTSIFSSNVPHALSSSHLLPPTSSFMNSTTAPSPRSTYRLNFHDPGSSFRSNFTLLN